MTVAWVNTVISPVDAYGAVMLSIKYAILTKQSQGFNILASVATE